MVRGEGRWGGVRERGRGGGRVRNEEGGGRRSGGWRECTITVTIELSSETQSSNNLVAIETANMDDWVQG